MVVLDLPAVMELVMLAVKTALLVLLIAVLAPYPLVAVAEMAVVVQEKTVLTAQPTAEAALRHPHVEMVLVTMERVAVTAQQTVAFAPQSVAMESVRTSALMSVMFAQLTVVAVTATGFKSEALSTLRTVVELALLLNPTSLSSPACLILTVLPTYCSTMTLAHQRVPVSL